MADRKRAHFQYLMSVHVNGNFSAKFFWRNQKWLTRVASNALSLVLKQVPAAFLYRRECGFAPPINRSNGEFPDSSVRSYAAMALTIASIRDPFRPEDVFEHSPIFASCLDSGTTIRHWFIGLDCSKGSFPGSDAEFAAELQKRGVPLQTVESALLLGAARKYESWQLRTKRAVTPKPPACCTQTQAILPKGHETPTRIDLESRSIRAAILTLFG